jgi:hypothetical protein
MLNLSRITDPWNPTNLVSEQARYTPAFASTSGDAVIGTTGAAVAGSYQRTGKQLSFNWIWRLGTGGTIGTGDLLAPLPPGYTAEAIDSERMSFIDGLPYILLEGASMVLASVPSAIVAQAAYVAGPPDIIIIQAFGFVAPTAGDQFGGVCVLPLK